MSDSDTYWTLATAEHFAGSFFSALATAGLRADPANRSRLVTAFPELGMNYGPHTSLHISTRNKHAS